MMPGQRVGNFPPMGRPPSGGPMPGIASLRGQSGFRMPTGPVPTTATGTDSKRQDGNQVDDSLVEVTIYGIAALYRKPDPPKTTQNPGTPGMPQQPGAQPGNPQQPGGAQQPAGPQQPNNNQPAPGGQPAGPAQPAQPPAGDKPQPPAGKQAEQPAGKQAEQPAGKQTVPPAPAKGDKR